MNYYLKYLKYKQKYLDLKNLDLNGGISINNYKDLKGGVDPIQDLINSWIKNRYGTATHDRRGGCYLMLDTSVADDIDNHIHVYQVWQDERHIIFHYSLKILGRHVRFFDWEITELTNDMQKVQQELEKRYLENPQQYIFQNTDDQNSMYVGNKFVVVKNNIVNNYEQFIYNTMMWFSQIARILLMFITILHRHARPTTGT